MWHRWEYWFWAGIAALALLAVLIMADRAEAHPTYLIPEDGVMTVELARHRSAWLRLMELKKLNGPYTEEVMPHDSDYQPRSKRVTAPPLAPAAIRALVEAYFRPGDIDTVMRVIACESGFNPDAKNPRSSAAGIAQFLRGTWNWVAENTGSPTYAEGGPYDVAWSVTNMAWLWYHGGPQHWTCYR